MNESKKLTIRINLRPQQDKVTEQKPVYYWGRIIGVSLVVVVAVATLVSAGSYYYHQDNVADQYLKSTTNLTLDNSPLTLPIAPSSSNTDSSEPPAHDDTPLTSTTEPSGTALNGGTDVQRASQNDSQETAMTVDEVENTSPQRLEAENNISVPPSVNERVAEEKIAQTATTEPSGTAPALNGGTVVQRASLKDSQETAIAVDEVENTSPQQLEAENNISVPPSVDERVVEEVTVQTATTKPSGTTATLSDETEVSTTGSLPVNEATVKQVTVQAEVSSEPAVVSVGNENNEIAVTARKETTVVKQSEVQPGGPFTQSKSEILSEKIKRFVISRSVKSNEPVGTIKDIDFDANNIATVYAYSEVRELKDKTLYYAWSLDGKDIARVKVDVGSNLWRSYSSKFIQPGMRGEWKIELQNEKGENLAVNQFNY